MRRRRQELGAGPVAFIDVMSCGLGVVILLFVLLDFRPSEKEEKVVDPVPVQNQPVATATAEDYEKELSMIKTGAENIASLSVDISSIDLKIRAREAEVQSNAAAERTLKSENKKGDLVGIKVNRSRIAILLDVSGSMYSKSISENIAYSLKPTKAQRIPSEKWKQAKSVAKWLIEVAPENSKFKFVLYSNKINHGSSGWLSKSAAVESLKRNLQERLRGGTDLSIVFEWAARNLLEGTQVFLITDGLPTLAEGGKFSVSKKLADAATAVACRSSPKGFVTGACREKLFQRSLNLLAGTAFQINVILLPLEGDPKAPPLYWQLAQKTQGILFAPDQAWP